MAYYHVSSYAKDGQVYFLNQKPLQQYIDEFEAFSVNNYAQFVDTCNLIPTTILQETGIRKSKWLCELIFENVRKESFYQLPRRMHSIYLCKSLEEAQVFNRSFRKNEASIFEAIFEGTVYQFDMNLFTLAEEYLFNHSMILSENIYKQVKSYAYEYWSQKLPMKQIEYMYEGTVKLKIVHLNDPKLIDKK